MNWRLYFNTDTANKARKEIKGMGLLAAVRFIRDKYGISLHDCIDFAKSHRQ